MRWKAWAGVVFLALVAALAGPFFSGAVGDPTVSEEAAFATGGPWGLGYDYLGRPVAPQILEGGRALVLAGVAAALVSQILGFGLGTWIAFAGRGVAAARFALDALLVVPMTVAALVAFDLAGSSMAATVPVVAILTMPFSTRYYRAAVEPVLGAGFYEQARVAGDSAATAVVREIVPVLVRPILAECGLSFIAAIYLVATVAFLGTGADDPGFLWPMMVSKNLPGMSLNPWACMAPVLAIVVLTVPVNLLVDGVGGDRVGRDGRNSTGRPGRAGRRGARGRASVDRGEGRR